MKILLVDDNKSVTEILSEFFKLKGDNYEVETAENGALALDKYNKFKPDVVVLDLSMPVMEGIETLTRLLKMDENATVVMATAADARERIEICLKKGALGYIIKPFNGGELLASIKNALQAGENRNLVALFSLARSKIEANISKMVGSNVSLTLLDVDVNPTKSLEQTFYSKIDPSEIRSVPKIEEVKYTYVPEGSFASTTEIGGQVDGKIISIINREDLNVLLSKNAVTEKVQENDTFLEFFNIINTNLLSQLADSMHIQLVSNDTRLYDKEKDSIVEGKDFTRARFNISWKEKTIPFDIHLWFNAAHLFIDGF